MSNKINQEWQNDWTEIALTNSVYPVLWLSPEARIIRFNQALETILDYDSNTLQSLTLFDLNEELTKKIWKSYWATLLEEKRLVIESQLDTKKGQSVLVELSFILIEAGTFNLCCMMVKEISKDTDSAVKLEEANFLLDMIVKERSESSKNGS